MNEVFLLWCVHESANGSADEMLIGVYRTSEDAEGAIARLRDKPGFRDSVEGFQITRYELNTDHWTEGFVTG